MEKIKIKNILTLEDKKNYVVVSKIEYESNQYFYLADIKDASNLMIVKLIGESLEEIEDEETLKIIIPLMCENAVDNFIQH